MYLHIISKKQAKNLGMKSFFTGILCKNKHLCERFVSNGRCVLCVKDSYNKFFVNNKEKISQQCKIRWQRNKTQYCEQYKEYRETNKEKIANKNKTHRSKNKERYSAYKKHYYSEHKEQIKQHSSKYSKNNRHIGAAAKSKRKALKINATPKWLEKEILFVTALYGAARYLSTLTGNTYHIDHIVPLNSNCVCGLHCLDNLQILLAEDNLNKSNKFEIF